MTDKQWAPEPWTISEWDWFNDANGEMIGEPVDTIEGYHLSLPELNRIIACVNACAGVPTEVLEHPNFHGMCKIVCGIAMVGKIAHEAKEPPDATES